MRSRALSRAVNGFTFGRIKYGWWSSDWSSNESPIFVGGCPRTGTTLVYSILAAHSRIYVALESALLIGNRDPDHLAGRLDVPVDVIEQALHRSHCCPDFTQRVLMKIMKSKGKSRWGDKSPLNVTSIGQFFRWFPRGRFVHLVRDGRDVVCSLRTHNGAFGALPVGPVVNPWPRCVERWVAWTRMGMKWRNDPRYLEIRYESLVDNVEATIRGMIDWLGEPWEPDILHHARRPRVASHPSIAQPIDQRAVARWHNDLDEEGRTAFIGAGQQLLMELGYADDDRWMREVRPTKSMAVAKSSPAWR